MKSYPERKQDRKDFKDLLRKGREGRLCALRLMYLGNNEKRSATRFQIAGNETEQWIIDSINKMGVNYEGRIYDKWSLTSKDRDIFGKEDAEDISHGIPIQAQIKIRQIDSGSDILYCISQPYRGRDTIREMLINSNHSSVGRDYAFNGHIYCALAQNCEKVRVIDYRKSIKPRIDGVINELLEDKRTFGDGECFRSNCYPGLMLQNYKDECNGEPKVCAFFPDELLVDEIQWIDMIDPPFYLFEKFLRSSI